jgi:hypothetical protein
MPGLTTLGLSRSSSVRAAESQTTATPSTPVTTKLPYWAPTAAETQAAQVVTSSRSGRKHVAASKATPTPTPAPAQAIPRKPVPLPTTPARKFSYEPVVGNPYAEPVATTSSRNPLRAAPAANNRSNSPPYVPGARAQSPEQLRPLSPGSIFPNGGTPPAPPHTRNGSLAAISRGVGSLKKASSTVKQASSTVKHALTPQHAPKISSPIPGSFQRGLPAGHVLAQEELAPLNLVGLEVAQANTARYAQPAFQFATGPGAGETARITATRRDAYRRLTGEAAPATLGSPSAPSFPSASTPAPPKQTTPRKAVNSTFGDVIDAGMDASWAGNVSAPTDTPPPPPTNNTTAELNPFAALGSAAQMFKKQGQANQPLPSTSVPQTSASLVPKPLAPRPLRPAANASQAVQLASQAPLVPGTDFTQDPRDRRVSQMLHVSCAKCHKVILAAAISNHHCAKPAMTEERKHEIRNMRISLMSPKGQLGSYPSRCVKIGEWVAMQAEKEAEAPEVFLDTYVQAAQTVWRTVARQ